MFALFPFFPFSFFLFPFFPFPFFPFFPFSLFPFFPFSLFFPFFFLFQQRNNQNQTIITKFSVNSINSNCFRSSTVLFNPEFRSNYLQFVWWRTNRWNPVQLVRSWSLCFTFPPFALKCICIKIFYFKKTLQLCNFLVWSNSTFIVWIDSVWFLFTSQ